MIKVRASIIKFNTPLHIRRFLSGQHNAKAHAVRPVAMADALEAFHSNEQDWRQGRLWRDANPAPSLTFRVKAMLEETGLNAPDQPAVCLIFHVVYHSVYCCLSTLRPNSPVTGRPSAAW